MKDIDFSMTYLALKMFGKQLYANMSAAVAELVANGLDANANNVFVYMDITDKNNSQIIIFDDGDGMNDDMLEKDYAVIGKNKRNGLPEDKARKIMGRKGIGKLAALYLSNSYTIITKQLNTKARAWRVDVSNIDDQSDSNNNAKPKMKEIAYPFSEDFVLQDKFENSSKGTVIYLNNVKINNFGEAAAEALEHRLANYFLVESLEQQIMLCIRKKSSDTISFNAVKKNVAFENMAVIFSSDNRFESLNGGEIKFKDETLITDDKIYSTQRLVNPFPDTVETTIKNTGGNNEKLNKSLKGSIIIDGNSYNYELKGWIGIHCSIEKEKANLNTKDFEKNIYYNPNQIRVYVRNKLATSSFLSYLGMTATLLNYIEGEISFDILDVEGLEDITTAGRDNFSVQDERVKLLVVLCKGIVSDLIRMRQNIANEMRKYSESMKKLKEQEEQRKIQAKFNNGQIESRNIIRKLPQDEQKALEKDFTQFSRACNSSNETNTIFISHKEDCKNFGNYLIDILLKVYPPIGDSIIFTSNSDYGVPQGEDIYTYLSSCFRDDMHVVFLFSRSFYDSNVCLGEAGAAWGTNKKYSNFVIDLGFSAIDKPINNAQKGAVLIDFSEDSIKNFANEIIRILESVGVSQKFSTEEVVKIIKEEHASHEDLLGQPFYKPLRRFQAVPICSACKHPMILKQNDKGELYYDCTCGEKLNAKII